MTLNTKQEKAPHIDVTIPESQISHKILAKVSKILAIFHFSIGHNVKFQCALKILNSKFLQVTFVGTIPRNIQKKLCWKRFITVVVVTFRNLYSHRDLCYQKFQSFLKNVKFEFSNNQLLWGQSQGIFRKSLVRKQKLGDTINPTLYPLLEL